MKRYFLGIDIGTFESRGILIDESFRVAADASVPHGMETRSPGGSSRKPRRSGGATCANCAGP